MKKLISLFLFFSFVNLFSQEYHFDYSMEIQTNRIKPNKEKTISTSFYDSKHDVHLRLTKYNDKLRATIYDKDKKLRHSFKVTESKGSFIFEYTHTNDFSKDKNRNFSQNDIVEVTKIDSLKYQVVAFKNKKKTRRRLTAIITLEKSNFNYLEIYIEHSKTNEMEDKLKELLDPNLNFVVKDMQLDYSIGYFSDTTFRLQDVDFSVNVPEKLIIKKFDFFGEFQD